MPTTDIVEEQDALQAHQYQFWLFPQYWLGCSDVGISSWNTVKLRADQRSLVPEQPGIYTLLVQPGVACHPACSYLMYVGKSNSLRRRFGEYLNEANRETGRPKVMRLLSKYADHTWFCYALVEESLLGSTEEALIGAYIPPANDRFPAHVQRVVGAF